jgi:hypothetical protein
MNSRLVIACIFVSAVALDACKKSTDTVLSLADTQNVNGESATDSFIGDATDMASLAVGSISSSTYTGRVEAGVDTLVNLDSRFSCATFSISRTGNKLAPAGTITIDFSPASKPSGCTDARGVTRKGQIIVKYEGKRFTSGSTIVTTFNNYTRNGVKIEGTHTLTNTQTALTDPPKYTVVLTGGKLTFTDGKVITREQSFTYIWQRAANPTQDRLLILAGGTASGTTKAGTAYTMSIQTDLYYSRPCAISNKTYIPIQGSKLFTANNIQYTVDYGTGTCDNDIRVTVNGNTKTITVNPEGN